MIVEVKMKILLILYLVSSECEVTNGANILVSISAPFYSHHMTFRPLWRALASRGHKLMILTSYSMEHNENITQIDYKPPQKTEKKHFEEKNIFEIINEIYQTLDETLSERLTHPGLIGLLKDEKKFDLIFSEIMNPLLPIFQSKFQCPLISIFSMDPPAYLHGFMGNAMHPAIYTHPILDYQDELSFKERLINTLFVSVFHFTKEIIFSLIGKYVERYIGEELPNVFDVEKNASLIFINANPVLFSTRPITPKTINIGGGFHFTEAKPLPKDLQTYLDESKHGCVYFSFGSMVDSNTLTPEVMDTFREVFEELAPIRVLWKFENDTMTLKPGNIELRKWIPQHDVLRHANVRVFITQGGLHSMEEAIDSSVPMLGIPFYGDQFDNVRQMVLKEFGLRLDLKTLDKHSLKNALLELLNNPKYKKNIKRLSAISKDQPMSGLKKAVWWTEYVLRHETTEHLRSPSADIPLYQYFFLDIMMFLFVVFIFTVLIFYYSLKLIRRIFRVIFSKKYKFKVN